MSLQDDSKLGLSQQLFDALADPTRRTIIELLATNGQMSASDIYDKFNTSNPAVSQHLGVLRQAELVQMKKSAQKHIYSLNPKTMRHLEEWIRQTTEHWSQRFDELDTVLEAEKRKLHKRGR